MPPQPQWFHRLDAIARDVQRSPVSHLDRRAIERLFGVRERRARQLMAGIAGLQVGNAVAVEREALLRWIEELRAGAPRWREKVRLQKVLAEVEASRYNWQARQVSIPVARGVAERGVRNLREGTELRPGELRVRFASAEELAGKLYELSVAMANDWDDFVTAVEGSS